MKFKAEIDIMPHKELLDPQGKTLTKNMHNLQIDNISDIRVGKHIHVELEAEDENAAKAKVELACNKLFINPIMESFRYEIYSLD